MRFADIRTEWRVDDIERQLRSKADNYEVSKVSSDVDSLERALREISSLVNGLRIELQASQDEIRACQNRIDYLEEAQVLGAG